MSWTVKKEFGRVELMTMSWTVTEVDRVELILGPGQNDVLGGKKKKVDRVEQVRKP
jgi:hypothetical protein